MEASTGSDDLVRLYGGFMREREGAKIMRNQHAFLTYIVTDEGCVIRDIYCEPEFRRQGHAKALFHELVVEATRIGCTYLSCQVDLKAKNAQQSFGAIYSQGFKPVRAHDNLIVFALELV